MREHVIQRPAREHLGGSDERIKDCRAPTKASNLSDQAAPRRARRFHSAEARPLWAAGRLHLT